MYRYDSPLLSSPSTSRLTHLVVPQPLHPPRETPLPDDVLRPVLAPPLHAPQPTPRRARTPARARTPSAVTDAVFHRRGSRARGLAWCRRGRVGARYARRRGVAGARVGGVGRAAPCGGVAADMTLLRSLKYVFTMCRASPSWIPPSFRFRPSMSFVVVDSVLVNIFLYVMHALLRRYHTSHLIEPSDT